MFATLWMARCARIAVSVWVPGETLMLCLPVEEPLFQAALKVVDVLRDAGHEAWIVGGAVRDLLLGETPPDYDIATSARPEQVMALFRKTVPVGVQFGVVRVRLMGCEFEVATLRADAGYSDGRRPDAVRFTDLREDVLRRDFTINGLALDPMTGEVIDLVGGQRDLADGVLRAIGDPDARFAEDRLRPLRAVRFAARTGFTIEPGTRAAITRYAAAVTSVSAERIADEMRKMLMGPRPGDGIRLMAETGLLASLLPELDVGTACEVAAVALDRVDTAEAGQRWVCGWALLLWPLGEAGAAGVMTRLRHSRRMVGDVAEIIGIGHRIRDLDFEDVAATKRLLRQAQAPWAIATLGTMRPLEGQVDKAVKQAQDLLAGWTHEDLHPQRLVTGNDAMAAGVARGPAVAQALVALEDAQLRGDVRTQDEALALLARLV